jgi:hypothetical protein
MLRRDTRLERPSLDGVGIVLRGAGDADGVDAVRPPRVPVDPTCRPAEEPSGAVRVPAKQVHVPGSELRQPLEELGIPRATTLLPGRLPRLVGREEPPGVEVLTRQPVVVLK